MVGCVESDPGPTPNLPLIAAFGKEISCGNVELWRTRSRLAVDYDRKAAGEGDVQDTVAAGGGGVVNQAKSGNVRKSSGARRSVDIAVGVQS